VKSKRQKMEVRGEKKREGEREGRRKRCEFRVTVHTSVARKARRLGWLRLILI